MGISIFPSDSSQSNPTNDFTVNVGSTGYTNVLLSSEFPAGSYICTSSLGDSTLDIYFLDTNGTIVGAANAATASTTITASVPFSRVLVYGGQNNDTLTFQFKFVFSPTLNTDNITAPPKITSIGTAALPNQNNTTTVSGENFASGITATFTGTDSVVRNAKSVVRNSSSSLTVTRPDTMPPTSSPYTLTLSNPGVPTPTSSNAHKLINGITAGSNVVWSTTTVNPMYYGQAFSQQLSASDADAGSTITYTIASGSLPTGVSLSSSGLISGTPTSTTHGTYSPIIAATDSGGNATNRSFSFLYASALGGTITNTSGSTIQHSFSANGTFVPYRSLTVNYSLLGGGGGGGGGKGGGGGGGGAGVVAIGSTTVSANQSVTLGSAGAGAAEQAIGSAGTSSTFGAITGSGGNGGSFSPNGYSGGTGGNGGSGGGGGGTGEQPIAAGAGGAGGSTGGSGTAGTRATNAAGNGGAGGNGSGNASSPGAGGGGGGGTNTGGRGGGGAGGNPGGGAGGYGNQGDPSAGIAGSNASSAGAGGGGGGGRWGGGGATGYAGGNGSAGTVTITY